MKRLEDRDWWPELVALKDVFSLRELAERFGAAPAAIANALRRNKLDRAPAPSGPRAHRSADWKQAADEAMTVKVEAPAAPAVSAAPTAPAAPAPVAAPAEAAPPRDAAIQETLRGYRVVIDRQSYIVVASDVASAAQLATGAGRGEVSSLELLGFALAS